MASFKKIFLVIGAIFSIGCSNPYLKAMKTFQNMPSPDLSFVIKPTYKTSKESIELKVKELYDAEKVRFDISHFYRIDPKTQQQDNEKFWPSIKVLNSSSIDINDIPHLDNISKDISQLVMQEIKNDTAYKKVEVIFLKQWKEGDNIRSIKQPIYFTYPELQKASWGE